MMRASMELVNTTLPLAILAGLLLAACWFDVRSHRIPNRLVALGMAAGVACNALLASGLGFVSGLNPGGIGMSGAVAGALTGAAMLLPLYLIRGMGAGDVKLMAMVGAFLGPLPAIDATLTTFVMGGFLAAAVACWSRSVPQAMQNICIMVKHPAAELPGGAGSPVEQARASAGKIPYAVAIATGTLVYALLARAGHTFLA